MDLNLLDFENVKKDSAPLVTDEEEQSPSRPTFDLDDLASTHETEVDLNLDQLDKVEDIPDLDDIFGEADDEDDDQGFELDVENPDEDKKSIGSKPFDFQPSEIEDNTLDEDIAEFAAQMSTQSELSIDLTPNNNKNTHELDIENESEQNKNNELELDPFSLEEASIDLDIDGHNGTKESKVENSPEAWPDNHSKEVELSFDEDYLKNKEEIEISLEHEQKTSSSLEDALDSLYETNQRNKNMDFEEDESNQKSDVQLDFEREEKQNQSSDGFEMDDFNNHKEEIQLELGDQNKLKSEVQLDLDDESNHSSLNEQKTSEDDWNFYKKKKKDQILERYNKGKKSIKINFDDFKSQQNSFEYEINTHKNTQESDWDSLKRDTQEVTIDYSQNSSQNEQQASQKNGPNLSQTKTATGSSEDDETHREKIVHSPNLSGLENVIQFSYMLSQKSKETTPLFAFISQYLNKKFATTSLFYFYDDIEQKFQYHYSDISEDPSISKKMVKELEEKNLNTWKSATLPNWSDDLFQTTPIRLIYPYFEGLKYMGFAALVIRSPINQLQAQEIEVQLESLRSCYLNKLSGYSNYQNTKTSSNKSSKQAKGFFKGLFGKLTGS